MSPLRPWRRTLMWALTLLLTLAGCGAPEMTIAAECWASDGRTHVWVEAGHPALLNGYTPAQACASIALNISAWRTLYEGSWGRLDKMEAEGWVFRARAGHDAMPDHASMTYHLDRYVDIGAGAWWSVPHEMHHVRLGEASSGHWNWSCPGQLGAWEEAEGMWKNSTENGYLPPCSE